MVENGLADDRGSQSPSKEQLSLLELVLLQVPKIKTSAVATRREECTQQSDMDGALSRSLPSTGNLRAMPGFRGIWLYFVGTDTLA